MQISQQWFSLNTRSIVELRDLLGRHAGCAGLVELFGRSVEGFSSEHLLPALVHSSFANECGFELSSNERLEFLGDAALQVCVSGALYRNCSEREGVLSRKRSSVVSSKGLLPIARHLGLEDCLLLGRGDLSSQTQLRESVLTSCLEALIGAVYDGFGHDACQTLVEQLITQTFEVDIAEYLSRDVLAERDPRSHLDTLTVREYGQMPDYDVNEVESGFSASCKIGNDQFGPVVRENKKEAIHQLCRMVLEEKFKCS